jgi:DNA polymerase III epsilon subunit-like protein
MRRLVIDVETGGLDPSIDAIVSLGCVLVEDWTPTAFKYIVVNDADGNHGEVAEKLHGITADMSKQIGLLPFDAYAQLLQWMEKYRLTDQPKIVLVGHNVNFDFGFLRRLFRLASATGESFRTMFDYRLVDVASIARFLDDCGIIHPVSISLESLAEYFKVPLERKSFGTHNALEDATATASIYGALQKHLKKVVYAQTR